VKHFRLDRMMTDREGALSKEEFRAPMAQLDASLDEMAHRLGIARRLIAAYRKDKPIQPAVALAVIPTAFGRDSLGIPAARFFWLDGARGRLAPCQEP
jgi:hypothetical protein